MLISTNAIINSYVLLRNAAPAGRFDAHLEILSGSADELDSQQVCANERKSNCSLRVLYICLAAAAAAAAAAVEDAACVDMEA